MRKGRNVTEGYRRGVGELKKRVLTDPLFQNARSLSKEYTIINENKIVNIFLILKYFLSNIPTGHIIEFGSYRGGNAIFMGFIAKQLYPRVKIFALDTYKGMPDTDSGIDIHRAGDFSDTSLADFRKIIKKYNLDNIIPVEGYFEDTAAEVLKKAVNISFAHIDCDIYEAVKYSYDVVKPFMVDGGYVIFDDPTAPTCLGAMEAVEELLYHRDKLYAEQVYPHHVFRIFA